MSDTAETQPLGRDLVTPVQIETLCAGRDTAIDHWMTAHESFHRHTKMAGLAAGVTISLPLGRGYSHGDTALSEAFLAEGKREEFRALLTKDLDRRCWQQLMQLANGEALMDRQAKEEFRASLIDPPAFTAETCRATFGHLWENRRHLYLRGIANTFSRLDRRFRSHDGFKIGARLIIDGALEIAGWSKPYWRNHDRQDTLCDVERIFHELGGTPGPALSRSVADLINGLRTSEVPAVVAGDYFRVRVFKNGNLHLWFERDDLLRQVNKLLAEYYGEAIGDGYNSTEADNAPGYHVTPARKFGAFNTSGEIAQTVLHWADTHLEGKRVLEPSAGTGVLAMAARAKGAAVTCVEIQPGLAHELSTVHGFEQVHARDFLTCDPAEIGQFDLVLMNPPFDRGRDCDHVRHAWQFVKPGGTLCAIMAARAEFGEDARHRALHRIIESANTVRGVTPWWDLPPGSFAHAGTMVNTVCLIIRKKR